MEHYRYIGWKLTWDNKIEETTIQYNYDRSRPELHKMALGCYQRTFNKGEIEMLKFLVKELQAEYTTLRNYTSNPFQDRWGDIVYNKLGENDT